MVHPASFTFLDPQVLSTSANGHETEESYHATWSVSYDEVAESNWRVVIATLHAGDEEGQVTVTIGGTFTSALPAVQDLRGEELELELRHSYALSSLYEVARTHARIALASADLNLDLPIDPPDGAFDAVPPSEIDDQASDDSS